MNDRNRPGRCRRERMPDPRHSTARYTQLKLRTLVGVGRQWSLLCCESSPSATNGCAGRDVKYKFNPGKSTERPAWPISGLCELFARILFALLIAIVRGEQRGQRLSDKMTV